MPPRQESRRRRTGSYATHASAVRGIGIILLGLLVALIGFFIYRHVSGGLDRMVGMFSATERNLDFTGRLQIVGNDELSQVGQAFNNLLERLQGSLRQIFEHAESVSHAARRVSAASRQMSVASQYQSEAASSMAAAVEEMTVSVNHVDTPEPARQQVERWRFEVRPLANV